MLLGLYNLLCTLAFPALLFYRPFRGSLRQRLGQGLAEALAAAGYQRTGEGLRLLANAVSAGEVAAVSSLLAEVRRQDPEAQIILLTTTDSGVEMARQRLAGVCSAVLYFPLADLWFVSRRYLEAIAPDIYVTTESELWPNVQAQCRRRGIPTALVNARLYLHNKRGLRGWFVRQLYLMLDLIDCQDFRQAAYFHKFGVGLEDRPQLTVSGNTKFDLAVPSWDENRLVEWRRRLGLSDLREPVCVAGSTHEGEEALVLDALLEARLDMRIPHAKLILAPRHIERCAEVEALSRERGLRTARLSQLGGFVDWDVLVVDQYGVLVDCYRIADMVVMGGTFNPKVGGHNILEATALGKPVVAGPSNFGIRSQLEMLRGADAVVEAEGMAEVAGALRRFLGDPLEAGAVGQRALAVTEANQGAAKRAAQRLLTLAEGARALRERGR